MAWLSSFLTPPAVTTKDAAKDVKDAMKWACAAYDDVPNDDILIASRRDVIGDTETQTLIVVESLPDASGCLHVCARGTAKYLFLNANLCTD
jgi:hypothetical protein